MLARTLLAIVPKRYSAHLDLVFAPAYKRERWPSQPLFGKAEAFAVHHQTAAAERFRSQRAAAARRPPGFCSRSMTVFSHDTEAAAASEEGRCDDHRFRS